MKPLRIFFFLPAIALTVSAITMTCTLANAQPPFHGTSPRMIAAGTVVKNSNFNKSWNMNFGKPGSMTCVWNNSNKWYEIKIPGVNYYYRNFATLVTTSAGGSSNPVSVAGAVIGSVGGKLLVSPIDSKGNRVMGDFSFVVFQYPSAIP